MVLKLRFCQNEEGARLLLRYLIDYLYEAACFSMICLIEPVFCLCCSPGPQMSTEGWESYLGQVKPLNIEPQVISDGKFKLSSNDSCFVFLTYSLE